MNRGSSPPISAPHFEKRKSAPRSSTIASARLASNAPNSAIPILPVGGLELPTKRANHLSAIHVDDGLRNSVRIALLLSRDADRNALGWRNHARGAAPAEDSTQCKQLCGKRIADHAEITQ